MNYIINPSWFYWLGVILTYISLALTVISLIDYIVKNKNVLQDKGE